MKTHIPPWQDMATLCANICCTEAEVLAMVRTGELPAPERNGLWRWSQVDRMLSDQSVRRVYFLEMGEFIKIGFSSNVGKRMEALSGGVPQEVRLLHDMPGTFEDETELHKRFKHLRARGEWFRKEPELLAYIEKIRGAE